MDVVCVTQRESFDRENKKIKSKREITESGSLDMSNQQSGPGRSWASLLRKKNDRNSVTVAAENMWPQLVDIDKGINVEVNKKPTHETKASQ